ncbi:Dual 3prime [Diplonema papillatum]|nr:Dual 3prime [Diplonema papillatum]
MQGTSPAMMSIRPHSAQSTKSRSRFDGDSTTSAAQGNGKEERLNRMLEDQVEMLKDADEAFRDYKTTFYTRRRDQQGRRKGDRPALNPAPPKLNKLCEIDGLSPSRTPPLQGRTLTAGGAGPRAGDPDDCSKTGASLPCLSFLRDQIDRVICQAEAAFTPQAPPLPFKAGGCPPSSHATPNTPAWDPEPQPRECARGAPPRLRKPDGAPDDDRIDQILAAISDLERRLPPAGRSAGDPPGGELLPFLARIEEKLSSVEAKLTQLAASSPREAAAEPEEDEPLRGGSFGLGEAVESMNVEACPNVGGPAWKQGARPKEKRRQPGDAGSRGHAAGPWGRSNTDPSGQGAAATAEPKRRPSVVSVTDDGAADHAALVQCKLDRLAADVAAVQVQTLRIEKQVISKLIAQNDLLAVGPATVSPPSGFGAEDSTGSKFNAGSSSLNRSKSNARLVSRDDTGGRGWRPLKQQSAGKQCDSANNFALRSSMATPELLIATLDDALPDGSFDAAKSDWVHNSSTGDSLSGDPTSDTLLHMVYETASRQHSLETFCTTVAMCCKAVTRSQSAAFLTNAQHPLQGIARAVEASVLSLHGSDIFEHPLFDPSVDRMDNGVVPTNALLFPMLVDGQVVGVLRLFNKVTVRRSVSGSERSPVRPRGAEINTVAKYLQLVTPMYQKQVFDTARQEESRDLVTIVQLLEEVCHSDTKEMVLQTARQGLEKLTKAEKVHLYTVCGQEDAFHCSETGDVIPFSMTSGIPKIVIETGESLVCDPASHPAYDASFTARAGLENARNLMCTPIMFKGKVFGAVQAMNKPKGDFTDLDIALAESLCTYIAVSLEHSETIELLDASSMRSTLMVSVCKELAASTLDVEALHKNIMEHARLLANADRASLFIANWKKKQLETKFDGKEFRMDIRQGIAGTVAMTAEALNIRDAYADSRFNKEIDSQSGYFTQNILAMPVKFQNEVLAVAQLVNKKDANGVVVPFEREDEFVLETFTSFAGISLGISAQYKKIEVERSKFKSMLQAVTGVADMDIRNGMAPICCNIMHQAKTMLEADRCSLFMIDKENSQLYSCMTDQRGGQIRFPINKGIAGEVARLGATLNIPDAYKDNRFSTEQDRLHGYVTRSILTVPVKGDSDAEALAVMQLINKKGGVPFDDEDEATLHHFSTVAGIAIKNIQLYEFTRQAREELSSVLSILNNSASNLSGGSDVASNPREALLRTKVMSLRGKIGAESLEAAKQHSFNIYDYLASEEIDGVARCLALVVLFFEDRGLTEQFHIDKDALVNFLCAIAALYRNVPYHNVLHAIDVTQTLFQMIGRLPSGTLTQLEELVLLLCGMCHDVDHMGLNNSFHYKAETPLGILSNATGGTSPLEVHHCDLTVNTLQRESCDIFQHVRNAAERTTAYKLLVKCILGTDMALHDKFCKGFAAVEPDDIQNADKELVMIMLLKAADISNCTKPFEVCRQWALRVLDEFYFQGDKEVQKIGQVSSELFDRNSGKEMADSQIGFINFVAKPFFEKVVRALPSLGYLEEQLNENLRTWSDVLKARRMSEKPQ